MENVYVGYSKNDFISNLINNSEASRNDFINNKYSINDTYLNNILINPDKIECSDILRKNWDTSCNTYNYPDNSLNCTKAKVCRKKKNIDNDTTVLKNLVHSPINPSEDECKIMLKQNWSDISCNYFFSDNSTNCIKNEICKNSINVKNIEKIDENHIPYNQRNLALDEEFKNTFLDSINLCIGIIFIVIVIFKVTNMVRKQK